MQKELEEQINDEKNGNEIKLTGKIRLNINQSGTFTIGRLCVKGIIQIKRSDIIIDGILIYRPNIFFVQFTCKICIFFACPIYRLPIRRNVVIQDTPHLSVGKNRTICYVPDDIFADNILRTIFSDRIYTAPAPALGRNHQNFHDITSDYTIVCGIDRKSVV